jgi:hypothetical protein
LRWQRSCCLQSILYEVSQPCGKLINLKNKATLGWREYIDAYATPVVLKSAILRHDADRGARGDCTNLDDFGRVVGIGPTNGVGLTRTFPKSKKSKEPETLISLSFGRQSTKTMAMAADDGGRRSRYRRRHEYFRTTIMLCCVIPVYLYVFLYVLEGGSKEGHLSYKAIKDWEREQQEEAANAVLVVEDNGQYDDYSSSPPSSPKEETTQHLLWRILVVYTIVRLWLCTVNHTTTTTSGHDDGGGDNPILPTTTATAAAAT